ncbi:MAG: hypothetical protein EBR82_55090 [Caulobacteraceae bacterium]|nr:hypothetical protein [Caulobacteraceae bacterium]
MNHYTLRFPDELNAEATADRLGYLDDNDELKSLGHEGAIDVVGQAMIPGTYDVEGKEINPPTIISGFFVNLSICRPLAKSLQQYVVLYGSGGRVFAGTIPDDNAWPPR